MSTLNHPLPLPFFRKIAVCPYAEDCRYAKVCEFREEPNQSVHTLRQLQGVAVSLAQGLLGTALLVLGAALILTLFLVPLGIPLALLGIALVSTSGEAANLSG